NGAFFAALDRLGGGVRTLAPLVVELPWWLDWLLPPALGDPERPFESLRVVEAWSPDLLRDPHRRGLVPLLAAAGAGFAASLLVRRRRGVLTTLAGAALSWLALRELRRAANLQSDCKPCSPNVEALA